MRRPVFERWMRKKLVAALGMKPFDMRAVAARVQKGGSGPFAAALLLYAYEAGRTDELMALTWSDGLRSEYERVIARLGGRSVEKLALRGTPMMSLPPSYRTLLEAYANDYHKPERISAAKRGLWEQARDLQLKTGVSSAKIAKDLELDPSNTAAYLKGSSLDRLSVESAREIVRYLSRWVADAGSVTHPESVA